MGFPAWINPFTVHIFFFSFFAVKVFFKINFFFFGVQLVSVVWQSESAIYISPLFGISFPFRLPQSN